MKKALIFLMLMLAIGSGACLSEPYEDIESSIAKVGGGAYLLSAEERARLDEEVAAQTEGTCYVMHIVHYGQTFMCLNNYFVQGVVASNAGWTVVETPVCCPLP